ncbi:MAG TPA: hypothetical protein P5132_02460 [Bacteroidales bacterium]|nr:hypothetical protein [Bacteroidales bacterium]
MKLLNSECLLLNRLCFIIYSCQSPQASENASEMGKLAYARKG